MTDRDQGAAGERRCEPVIIEIIIKLLVLKLKYCPLGGIVRRNFRDSIDVDVRCFAAVREFFSSAAMKNIAVADP